MKGAHDIYIIEANGKFRVRPAVWSTDAQDLPVAAQGGKAPTIRFRNLTGERVFVALPNILDPAEATAFVVEAAGDPGKNDIVAKKLKTCVKGGSGNAHPYSVFVLKSTGAVPAEGESDPIIIIDPPGV